MKIIKYILIILIVGNFTQCKTKEGNIPSVLDLVNDYYTETYRPQFHFSPDSMWMNDPNGMVYHDGEYHLFYQYYPDSTVWGPMHWGHAVSEDMVHWEHLPIALYPDSLGYIFSGSAVVDTENTSGLGTKENPPMIAIFTHHSQRLVNEGSNQFQYQSIAYSLDNGRTWTKYDGNPVVSNPGIQDFRDPKVIWDKGNKQWVMVFSAYDKVRFYTSPNLIDWEFTGTFGIEGDTRLWECPDLFPMTVEETGEEKWVLIVSIQQQAPNGGTATGYFVGDWDGSTFIGDPNNQKWMDYGTDNYAMVTWSGVPDVDGRTLALGWMSNWQYAQEVPTERWRSAMTLPRELNLHQVGEEYEVWSRPVEELANIEGEVAALEPHIFQSDTTIFEDGDHALYKFDFSFANPGSGMSALRFSNGTDYIDVGYNGDHYFVDRTFAGESSFSEVFAEYHMAEVANDQETIDMTIYLDHASVELFADDGKVVMTDIYFVDTPFKNVMVLADMNEVEMKSGSVTYLKNIWR